MCCFLKLGLHTKVFLNKPYAALNVENISSNKDHGPHHIRKRFSLDMVYNLL